VIRLRWPQSNQRIGAKLTFIDKPGCGPFQREVARPRGVALRAVVEQVREERLHCRPVQVKPVGVAVTESRYFDN